MLATWQRSGGLPVHVGDMYCRLCSSFSWSPVFVCGKISNKQSAKNQIASKFPGTLRFAFALNRGAMNMEWFLRCPASGERDDQIFRASADSEFPAPNGNP